MSAAARIRLRALAHALAPAIAARYLIALAAVTCEADVEAWAGRAATGDVDGIVRDVLARQPPPFEPERPDPARPWRIPIQGPRLNPRPVSEHGEIRGGFAEVERAARRSTNANMRRRGC